MDLPVVRGSQVVVRKNYSHPNAPQIFYGQASSRIFSIVDYLQSQSLRKDSVCSCIC